MILNIILAVVGLVIGGLGGYFIFRYVLTGKYNEMISAAQKEAEVLKEKKKLEVKEIFLNKSLNSKKRCRAVTKNTAEREPPEAERTLFESASGRAWTQKAGR